MKPRANARHYAAQWIRSLLAKGLAPLLEVIDAGIGDGHGEAERAWIAQYCKDGARLTNTGAGGLGFANTPEVRARIAESRRGKKHSEETKRKMALAQTGRKHSAESIRRMSESQKG